MLIHGHVAIDEILGIHVYRPLISMKINNYDIPSIPFTNNVVNIQM